MIRTLMLVTVFGAAFAAGCKHKCCKPDPCAQPSRPFLPSAPNNPYLLPPAGVPTTPVPPGGATVVPPVGPRNYPPPDFGPMTPGKPPPEVLFPDPIPGGGSSRSSSPGDPGYGVLGGPAKPKTVEPPLAAKASAGSVGLPGFARVKEGIASGRKPGLEGLDALKRAGYRTVIYLHPAGADYSAIREVVTKRDLAFVAIETTPEKLASAIAAFNSAIADKAARPAYVFDDDGVRAGALWYLHFRTAEALNDDAARIRAKPLGLTEQGAEAQAFALAIQRFLETR